MSLAEDQSDILIYNIPVDFNLIWWNQSEDVFEQCSSTRNSINGITFNLVENENDYESNQENIDPKASLIMKYCIKYPNIFRSFIEENEILWYDYEHSKWNIKYFLKVFLENIKTHMEFEDITDWNGWIIYREWLTRVNTETDDRISLCDYLILCKEFWISSKVYNEWMNECYFKSI